MALTLIAGQPGGRYQVEARIAATHAMASTARETDWRCIARPYVEVPDYILSPIVALNHAVAIAMAREFECGLELIDRIEGLEGYYLFHAAPADLLRRLGRSAEPAAAYREALKLVTNPIERDHLTRRLASLNQGNPVNWLAPPEG